MTTTPTHHPLRSVPGSRAGVARALGAAALATSLAHVLIDLHIASYGPASTSMSLLQFANLGAVCVLVAWWALCLAASADPDRAGLSGILVLSAVWAFLGNGLAAFLLAPPPADAAPYQDIVHVANIVVGGWAAYAARREIARTGARVRTVYLWGAVVVLVGTIAIEAVVSAKYG